MNYTNPELLRQLSAEYALGTLRGPARRRFERLLLSSADARAEVGFWEFRLSEFGQDLPPVAPPPRTRKTLLQRAAVPERGMPLAKEPARQRSLSLRRRRRRWLTAGAAALALTAAFLIGQRYSLTPDRPDSTAIALHEAPVLPASAAEESFDAPALYLTQLKLPASSMGWLLSLSRDHRRLTAVAADDYYTQGRQRFQLWWISPTRGPVALLALPSERFATTVAEIPREVLGESQVVFAISLEPLSGPRADKPSGPVLSTTPQIDHI